MKTRLPILEDIRIATPCNADWDEMSGDERVRFCGQCEKNVYNLSAMTRVEAETLVREREGRMCVRLYQRRDGTVLTADCPVGVQKQRLRRRVWASLSSAAASLMLVLGVFSGRARADLTVKDGRKHSELPHTALMGGPVHKSEVVEMGKVSVEPQPKKKHTEKPEPMMGDISPQF